MWDRAQKKGHKCLILREDDLREESLKLLKVQNYSFAYIYFAE